MKKRLLALLLVIAMSTMALSACGSTESTSSSGGNEAASSTVAKIDWTGYDSLEAEALTDNDFVDREAKLHQLEDQLMRTYCVVPIYYYNDIYMQKSSVDGVYCNLFGTKYFQYATNTAGDTLRINLAPEPDSLDPALNTTLDGGCLASAAFSGLFTYDESGEPVPDLVDSYTVSDDGMIYTFTLKDNLKWSDGSDLTARDFVYSWNRAASDETAAGYAYLYDIFARNDDGTLNVTASDDGKTLTATLTAPCAYFLELCAFPVFMPVPQASVEAADPDGTNPGAWCMEAGFISDGPYTCQSWTHNESMVYVKNPYYHNADKVQSKELDFMLSDDDTAIYSAYHAGDLDFIDTVPTDEIASLLDNPEFHIVDELGTYYVTFNANSSLFAGKTEEQAVAMRQAISLLIDRDYICENIGQTGQEPANSFIGPGMSDGHGGVFRQNDDDYTYPDEANTGYYDPMAINNDYEGTLQQARNLLTSAGYAFDGAGMLSSETPITFTYLTNTDSLHVAVAEAIQQDLAAIGITVNISQEDWNVFLEDRKNGNFDVARDGWQADYSDPINMLEMWTSDSGNNNAQFGK